MPAAVAEALRPAPEPPALTGRSVAPRPRAPGPHFFFEPLSPPLPPSHFRFEPVSPPLPPPALSSASIHHHVRSRPSSSSAGTKLASVFLQAKRSSIAVRAEVGNATWGIDGYTNKAKCNAATIKSGAPLEQ